jgi:hypothetical protein
MVFDAAFNQRFTSYIYGTIEYTDTYNKRWARDYCYVYYPLGGLANLATTESHNGEREIKQ